MLPPGSRRRSAARRTGADHPAVAGSHTLQTLPRDSLYSPLCTVTSRASAERALPAHRSSGGGMSGIDDVARRAGVSTATVSRALSGNGPVSETTRARVIQSASELGYVVSSNASGLASGRTRNIGAVVPRLDRWFFTSVIEGAQRVLLRPAYVL